MKWPPGLGSCSPSCTDVSESESTTYCVSHNHQPAHSISETDVPSSSSNLSYVGGGKGESLLGSGDVQAVVSEESVSDLSASAHTAMPSSSCTSLCSSAVDQWQSCAICLEDKPDTELSIHPECGCTLCQICIEVTGFYFVL